MRGSFLPPQAEENRAIEQSTIEQIDKEKFNCGLISTLYFLRHFSRKVNRLALFILKMDKNCLVVIRRALIPLSSPYY